MEKTSKIDLIWDIYPSHISSTVIEFCNAYNIALHFIPPGATDLLQPLDIAVFGSVKQIARKMWRDNYMEIRSKEEDSELKEQHIIESQSRASAVKLLLQVWDGIGMASFNKAWELYRSPLNEKRFDYLLSKINSPLKPVSANEFINDKRTIYDMSYNDMDESDYEEDINDSILTSKCGNTYEESEEENFFIPLVKQIDNERASNRQRTMSETEKALCLRSGINYISYNDASLVGTYCTEKCSAFAACLQLLYQIPCYEQIIKEISIKDIFIPALHKMENSIRIADITRYYNEWKKNHGDHPIEILKYALQDSSDVGFDVEITKHYQESKVIDLTQISENFHEWFLHASNEDIVSNLNQYVISREEPETFRRIHAQFSNFGRVIIVENNRWNDKDEPFVFPLGIIYEDKRYSLKAMINVQFNDGTPVYSTIIRKRNYYVSIEDSLIKNVSIDRERSYIALYLLMKRACDENDDETHDDFHIDKEKIVEPNEEDIDESEHAIIHIATKKRKNKIRKKKLVVRPDSNPNMKQFKDSAVGKYVCLTSDYCVKEIILTDAEISSLQITFGAIAKRIERAEKTKHPQKRGRPRKK